MKERLMSVIKIFMSDFTDKTSPFTMFAPMILSKIEDSIKRLTEDEIESILKRIEEKIRYVRGFN